MVLPDNFRGGDGNVGIIRSPVRAIALPDILTTRQSEPWEVASKDNPEVADKERSPFEGGHGSADTETMLETRSSWLRDVDRSRLTVPSRLAVCVYRHGVIVSRAFCEVMTGWTSKSMISLQFAIHSSSTARSSVHYLITTLELVIDPT